MSASVHLLQVGELDLVFEASRWAFAERHAASIAAQWARLTKAKPLLFNGRGLLLSWRAIETRFDGTLTLKGVYFETDYADFLAWEEFGFVSSRDAATMAAAPLQSPSAVPRARHILLSAFRPSLAQQSVRQQVQHCVP